MADLLTTLLTMAGGATPDDDIINVLGRSQPKGAVVPTDDSGPRSLGNRSQIEEARDAAANAPQRKGMFGLKGTLRDVLGTIGDAFLVNEGRDAVYAPRRQQERMSDALTGFTNDPMAAMERLANMPGGADAAAKLFDNFSQNQARMQSGATAAQKAKDANYANYSRLFSQYAGSATPETYSRFAPLLKTLKQRGGLGDEFQVPDQYDENLLKGYQYGGMPAQQQVRDIRAVEAESGRNQRAAASNKVRLQTDNPPPPRTISNVDADIADKIRTGTANPQETKYWNDRLVKGKSKSKIDFTKIPPPPEFKLKN